MRKKDLELGMKLNFCAMMAGQATTISF